MSKELITDLQSRGIRVPGFVTGRTGGAGPAEGRAFLIGDRAVNIPIAAPFVADSPYHLTDRSGAFILFKGAEEIGPIGVVPVPQFYGNQTDSGIHYSRIALLHGADCFATTVRQR